jgi:uncharacterized phiE125 gp8 family phage protein
VAIVTVTAPAIEPITLDDLKNDIKVDSDLTEDDFLIQSLITAGRRWIENTRRRALITQTLELWLDAWPSGDTIKVPRPPLQSVTHIKYYDTADSESAFSSGSYFVDTKTEPGRIVLNDGEQWPDTTLRPANGIVVRFVAGFGDDEANVPDEYRQALRLLAGHWYENRGAVASSGAVPKEVPFGVEALLWPDRVF